jgi:hypothetical protein
VARNIVIVIFSLLVVAGAIGTIRGFVCENANATEIIGLRTEIDSLRTANQNFGELNQRLEQSINDRKKREENRERERQKIIDGLRNAVNGATGDIQTAITGIRECQKLALQIEN